MRQPADGSAAFLQILRACHGIRSGRASAALPRPSKTAIRNSGWRFCIDCGVEWRRATQTNIWCLAQRAAVCGRES
jgi:hypothetical protein